MKIIFTILIVFSCSLVNAQFNSGTIYMKDSTKLQGLIRVKTLGGIKFKSTKKSEATIYDYKQIIGFDTDDKKYRYIKHKDGFPPRLFKEDIKGKISLYSNEVYNPGHTIPNGYAGGGTGMTFGGGSSTIYFVLVKNKLQRVGAKMKNKHLEIFKNCKNLMDKIESRDFKKKEVHKIINYYNQNCN